MKQFLIINILGLLFSLLHAQKNFTSDFKISTGKPYSVIDAERKEYFSSETGTTLAIKTDKGKVTIQRFDATLMKDIGKKKYSDFPKDMKVQKILKLKGKLFYIFSSFESKSKCERLYVREINMQTGLFEEVKLLFTSSREVAVSYYEEKPKLNQLGVPNLGKPIRFDVFVSEDSSRILVKYRLNPISRNDTKNFDEIGFYVFQDDFAKLWGGEVTMKFTEKEINNWAYGITNRGEALMLLLYKPLQQLQLVHIDDKLHLKTDTIDLKDTLFVQKVFLQEKKDASLKILTYYANGMEYKSGGLAFGALSVNTNGLLQIELDQNGKVVKKNKYEFPIELLKQNKSEKDTKKLEAREKKNKAGINDLQLVETIYFEDGSMILIGEQQYQREEIAISSNPSTETKYYYGDVVILKLDSIGQVEWTKKLPKNQVGTYGKGGMGIKCIKEKSECYLLFADHRKNLYKTIEEVPTKYKDGRKGYLMAYKLDYESGNFRKMKILNKAKINGIAAYQFDINRIVKASNKNFLLEVYIKNKKDTMVKMELK